VAPASAADLEVTHWWTSGGESAAVAEFAKAFDATGNKWVDGAIAGAGDTARPIMVSRITGDDPMGATQFNHGRQAEELVQKGLMQDLLETGRFATVSELAAAQKLNGSYVSHVLRLTLLAPDLLEAILDGRQPRPMQLQQLIRYVVDNWDVQREECA
jgi:hypothetical protein